MLSLSGYRSSPKASNNLLKSADEAYGDESTKLPKDLKHPKRWIASTDEKADEA
jgi:hypothetical protein